MLTKVRVILGDILWICSHRRQFWFGFLILCLLSVLWIFQHPKQLVFTKIVFCSGSRDILSSATKNGTLLEVMGNNTKRTEVEEIKTPIEEPLVDETYHPRFAQMDDHLEVGYTLVRYNESKFCNQSYMSSFNTIRKLLYSFDNLCKKVGVTYFLVYGSLLGSVREGGIIASDHDLDVMMSYEDFEKLELASKVYNNDNNLTKYRMTVQPGWRNNPWTRRITKDCGFKEPNSRWSIAGRGEYMDVWGYIKRPFRDNILYLMDKYRSWAATPFDKSSIYPLYLTKFEGLEVFCPRDSLLMVRTFYGDEWTQPARICTNSTWQYIPSPPSSRNW